MGYVFVALVQFPVFAAPVIHLNNKLLESYAGSKTLNFPANNTYAFTTLVTLEEIQEELGSGITSISQVYISACNGDWNTNSIRVEQVVCQPNSKNAAVMFDVAPKGLLRINYVVTRVM